MATMHVSSAVMTHPRRRERAEGLARRLGLDTVVVDPSPHEAPSALRTAVCAWQAVAPGATHHLVVQDDVSAAAGFLSQVARAVARHPSEALAFYTHWNSRNGAAVRLAALAGAAWVRGVPEEFTPTQAVCLPAAQAGAFHRYAGGSGEVHDDEILSELLRRTGRMGLLAVPNVVEHLDTDSISGHAWHGLRRSACLVNAAGVGDLLGSGRVLESVDCLPYMRRGAAHLRVEGPDGALGTRGHALWRDALPTAGLDPDEVLELVRGHRPADAAAAVARHFGSPYADELWIHCLLLGWRAASLAPQFAPPAGQDPFGGLGERIRATAVSTIGVGGLPPAVRHRVSADRFRLMAEYAWTGVRAGRTLAAPAEAGHSTSRP
ncbi:hypothetical protein GCM10010211_19460 [Streptomyces albospinus]|uniref:Glycosyltransferase n=1 Tax=Streptomyces albospinus TaxID=285515 RepID=A0ABQ2UUP3_9ACTN|nr:hypothetical protein [Streptomyces albospinus]GGU54882.1 hypothetical protein GCM10010211_19460 [Streptomyces albospinus]